MFVFVVLHGSSYVSIKSILTNKILRKLQNASGLVEPIVCNHSAFPCCLMVDSKCCMSWRWLAAVTEVRQKLFLNWFDAIPLILELR